MDKLRIIINLIAALRTISELGGVNTSPEALAKAITKLLDAADSIADVTDTAIDDHIVDFVRQYAARDGFVEMLSAVLEFVLGKAEEADEAGQPFDVGAVFAEAKSRYATAA